VRFLDQRIGLGPRKPWQVDLQLDSVSNPRRVAPTRQWLRLPCLSAKRCRRALHQPQHRQKGNGIAGANRCSGSTPRPSARQARAAGHFEVQQTVGGHRPQIPARGGLHVRAMQNVVNQRHSMFPPSDRLGGRGPRSFVQRKCQCSGVVRSVLPFGNESVSAGLDPRLPMKSFARFRLDSVNQCLWRRLKRSTKSAFCWRRRPFVLTYLVDHAGRW